MTNDAKLGLVVGIGAVILIAIVFFRRDAAPTCPTPDTDAAAQVQPASVTVAPGVESLAASPLPASPRTPPPVELEPVAPAVPKSRSR